MKIIVTGGAGFIGSHLVRHLLRLGHEVWNIDKLTYAGNLEALADVAHLPEYHFLKIDICDGEVVEDAFDACQPDAVMHLAAESHVDRSISGPAEFMRTNILGTYTLLEAARGYLSSPTPDSCRPISSSNFRFLHVSTDEVYGSLGTEGVFSESTPYDPRSPYSASKAASDHLVSAWHHTYGLPVILTHCSNNYGPWQYPEKLIPVVISKAVAGEAIPVYGSGKHVRDWIHVADHVAALALVLERGSIGETYNIGGNLELRNIDLVKRLCAMLDEIRPRPDGISYAGQIAHVTDRPGHDFRYALDAGKIREELGWEPKIGPDLGFRETVEWYVGRSSDIPVAIFENENVRQS